MKAGKLFVCAVAITYGVFVGKILGVITEGAVLAATKDKVSDKEDESETETE